LTLKSLHTNFYAGQRSSSIVPTSRIFPRLKSAASSNDRRPFSNPGFFPQPLKPFQYVPAKSQQHHKEYYWMLKFQGCQERQGCANTEDLFHHVPGDEHL